VVLARARVRTAMRVIECMVGSVLEREGWHCRSRLPVGCTHGARLRE
jgi:hypothetical protein